VKRGRRVFASTLFIHSPESTGKRDWIRTNRDFHRFPAGIEPELFDPSAGTLLTLRTELTLLLFHIPMATI